MARPAPWVLAGGTIVVAVTVAVALIAVARPEAGTPGKSYAAADPALTKPSPTTPPRTPPATAAPSPETEPTPAPTETAPSPSPVFERLAREVAAVRGLTVQGPVDARVVSAATLADKVREVVFADYPPDQVAADEALLKTLRLIPEDSSLRVALDTLYRAQIIGLYVPDERILYVATGGAELSPYERITGAHEVAHALQDQNFTLGGLRDLPDRAADATLALIALIEGDAVLTQQLWSARFQTDADRSAARAEARNRPQPSLEGVPGYLRATLNFPYDEGFTFVQALVNDGGLEAVDAAFADPPTTTTEILHPERYLEGFQPATVTVTGSPGEGWEENARYEFGEFDLRQWFAPLGTERAAVAAAGWAGGEVVGWSGPDGRAAGARLRFESPADTSEACDAVQDWYRGQGGTPTQDPGVLASSRDHLAITCTDTDVVLGIGPGPDAARAAGR